MRSNLAFVLLFGSREIEILVYSSLTLLCEENGIRYIDKVEQKIRKEGIYKERGLIIKKCKLIKRKSRKSNGKTINRRGEV